MRVDKFLKVSRLIKRRTIAKEVAEKDRIQINDKIAKPSSEVKVGDLITIGFGNKLVTIRVLQILESTKKDDAQHMYEIVKEEKI
ncbi:RNA-binding S4 domain-containing protein [Mycoplasmatota bacterium]|nr:RNA-binding S4 domain-containing protein [Mycoplasmatota bacterium]